MTFSYLGASIGFYMNYVKMKIITIKINNMGLYWFYGLGHVWVFRLWPKSSLKPVKIFKYKVIVA